MQITKVPAQPVVPKLVRVAAYARVSSDKDAAFHSLEAQTEYYKQYVSAHPNWQLVGIYSDNGISGTIINRPEFQRMFRDCWEGKIDLIITKSITRFARNTVALLEFIRELKRLGVDVYFEKENMHSISPDGELLVTLLAMYAEEEARSASENQRWRIIKRFENGQPWVGKMLGYRLENGRLVIIPEEAAIVRQIYEDYLSGMGQYGIAKKLKLQGISPASGNIWSRTSIRTILMNEKYTGNMILQKTYRKDFRSKTTLTNHGEIQKYYVKNSHEAIIDQETFALVQAEMAQRAAKYDHTSETVKNEPHLFCGILQCGFCGHRYKHYRTNAKKYDKSVWACPNYYTMGKSVCPAQKIPEDILIEKTLEILDIPSLNREILLKRVQQIVVPAHNRLHYILQDGTEIEAVWQHHSRRESWTPEMREQARQQTLSRYRTEEN